MTRQNIRILWGVLLIAGGALALLQNFGYFRQAGPAVGAVLLGVASVFFLSIFFTNRAHWWALIPGVTLLGLTVLVASGVFFPSFAETWGGSLVLGGIGLSFWLIYAVNREMWWAIIPGGVLATLALVAGIDQVFEQAGRRFDTGGIFFIGLGLTFTLLGLLPTPHGRMRWAFIPGGILLLMGLLIFAAAESLINYLWPIALIVVGLFLVYRTFRPRQVE